MDVRGMIARITIDFIEEGTDTVVSSVPAVIVVPDAVADVVRSGEQPFIAISLLPTDPTRWTGDVIDLDELYGDAVDRAVFPDLFKEHR